jgi:hypothetical protein
MRVYDESFPEASARGFRLNFALIEFQNRKQPVEPNNITDIGVGYVGFEVDGLAALLKRAEAGGAKLVSDPGIVTLGNGTREVIIRDPDVGGFVELFEKPKRLGGAAIVLLRTMPGARCPAGTAGCPRARPHRSPTSSSRPDASF